MKVTLEKSGDYAVRAVLDLAQHFGSGRRKNREIAAATHVPAAYLARILARLARAGIVFATAGPDGGYELARPPARISLLDVIEAVEEITVRDCVLRGGLCRADGTCAVHDAWFDAREALHRQLAATSFEDVVAASKRSGARRRPR
jgi:Rrf2 family iron-sulfur cluster assembly transcriptional regulator